MYEDRLRPMDPAYDQAPTAGTDELPPVGDYECVVDPFTFIESTKNGHLYLKTEMSVSSDVEFGALVCTLHDLEDPERFKYLKAHLKALQAEPALLSGIEQVLAAVVGTKVKVTVTDCVKTDGTVVREAYVVARVASPPPVDPADIPPAEHPPASATNPLV